MRPMAMWVVLAVLGFALFARAQDPGIVVYVGTYTGPKSQGIYMTRMDVRDGRCRSRCWRGR